MTFSDFFILGLVTWLVVLIGIEITWRRAVRREIRADREP